MSVPPRLGKVGEGVLLYSKGSQNSKGQAALSALFPEPLTPLRTIGTFLGTLAMTNPNRDYVLNLQRARDLTLRTDQNPGLMLAFQAGPTSATHQRYNLGPKLRLSEI